MKNETLLLTIILVVFTSLSSCGTDTPQETSTSDESISSVITEALTEIESAPDTYVETETDTMPEDTTEPPKTIHDDPDEIDEPDETLEYEDPLVNFDDSAYEENIREKEVMLTAPNNSKKITSLVDKYLSNRSDSVYDELFDIVYYEYTAVSDIYFKVSGGGMTSYYKNKETGESYYLPLKDEGLNTYYLVRYGELDTYQEISDYLHMHFSYSIASGLIFRNSTVAECGGKFYAREGSLGSYNFERDPVYTMHICNDMILLECVRTSYDSGSDTAQPTGRYTYYYSILRKYSSGIWLWSYLEYEGEYMTEEYEAYIASKKLTH